MELRQLKYFVKIAELLSFSEASKVLYITQSTLSQQIKQLEQELGSQLFERTSHSVALTEAGSELLPMARTVLDSAEMCFDKISDLNSMLTGCLNIGVTYSFAPILTGTLTDFMSLYPDIRLNIYYRSVDELMSMLRKREVDFVLAFRPLQLAPEIESHTLFQNYLAVIVSDSHPLASDDSLAISQLSSYDLALPVKGLQARNALDRLLEGSNCSLKVRAELNEVNILLDIVRRGNLATVLAEASIHGVRGVKALRLVQPDCEMIGCVHTLKSSYRKRSLTEFLRMLSLSDAVKERQYNWL